MKADVEAAPNALQSGDGKLLQRIAGGDQEAFTELYQRLQRPLFGFLVKLVREREMAEELLNETLLDVWRQAGRFEGKSSVSTWIYSIAHHKAVSRLRRIREHPLDEGAAEKIEDTAPTADMRVEESDTARLLKGMLDKLSFDHREVIQLAYYQEFSVQQIAEVLDLPENTVKTRMFYARQRLKALLEAAGVEGAVA
jgi:RNA polymerase sigma-70 factor (ECF subfamily)